MRGLHRLGVAVLQRFEWLIYLLARSWS